MSSLRGRAPAADHAGIIEMYMSGEHTIKEIAAKYGRSITTVYRVLREAGVPLRGRMPAADHAGIIEMYTSGKHTIKEIAAKYGRSVTSIYPVLKRAGVPTRNRIPDAERAEIVETYASGKYSVRQVAVRHGRALATVSLILREAGYPLWVRITDAERTGIIEMYTSGEHTVKEIAEKYGRSTTSISLTLKESGVPIRDRVSGAGVPQRDLILAAERTEIVEMHASGEYTVDEIAEKHGRSTGQIYLILREAGQAVHLPRSPISADQRADIIEMHASGEHSAKEIAKKHGCTTTTVYRILREAGF